MSSCWTFFAAGTGKYHRLAFPPALNTLVRKFVCISKSVVNTQLLYCLLGHRHRTNHKKDSTIWSWLNVIVLNFRLRAVKNAVYCWDTDIELVSTFWSWLCITSVIAYVVSCCVFSTAPKILMILWKPFCKKTFWTGSDSNSKTLINGLYCLLPIWLCMWIDCPIAPLAVKR